MKANVRLAVEKMKVIVSTGNEEQKQTVSIDFKVVASVQALARALYWQNKGCPLYLIVGTNQAELDLEIKNVNYQLKLVADDDEVEVKATAPAPAPAVAQTVPATAPSKSELEESKDGPKPKEIPRCPSCGFIVDATLEKGDGKCPSCGKPLPVTEQVPEQVPAPKRRRGQRKDAVVPPAVA